MVWRPHVLVVSQNRDVANTLLQSLLPHGYELSFVTTYAAAKQHLENRPDVVIADVKLGDYNGLQLAIHAKGMDIPAIVLGPDDKVLERDAVSIGCTYVTEPIDEAAFPSVLEAAVAPGPETPWDLRGASGISWWTGGGSKSGAEFETFRPARGTLLH